jgi:hypothetical protein
VARHPAVSDSRLGDLEVVDGLLGGADLGVSDVDEAAELLHLCGVAYLMAMPRPCGGRARLPAYSVSRGGSWAGIGSSGGGATVGSVGSAIWVPYCSWAALRRTKVRISGLTNR